MIVLTACADMPTLDGTISDTARDAPYPTLTPIPALVTPQTVVSDDQMSARIAALQARAERLRRIDIAALQ